MEATPRSATVKHLDKHRPPDSVKTACAKCDSEATRAVYQHNCNPGMVTWELPAYGTGKKQAPVKWACPLCKTDCAAVLVKCGNCGRIVWPLGHKEE